MSALFIAIVMVYSYPEYECVRWAWLGDVYNRKVVCLEWRKRNTKDSKK
jgi:hypothetical protein